MSRTRWLIVSLVSISAISALFDTIFFLRGIPSEPASTALGSTLFVFLLAMWIDADARNHRQVERAFDFGFFLLMFWLPYLPYYLWRTRGAAGLSTFVGFLGLFWMGFLIQLLIWGWYRL